MMTTGLFMMLADNNLLLLAPIFIFFLLPLGLAAVLSLWALRPWLRANAAGLEVTILEVAGMKLRRVDVYAVIDAMVIAADAGVIVSQIDLQRAYRAGADPTRVVQALLRSRDEERSVTIEQLVEIELRSIRDSPP